MHFFAAVKIAFLTLAIGTSYASPTDLSEWGSLTGSSLPFNLTYLFTANLSLGAATKPIPIPGGVRIIEPILNGTVSGPAINATIDYSLATPTVVNNGTLQIPVINVVGMSDDGEPFYIYELGIGSPSSQITRIMLEIGGSKYTYLQNGFILASVRASSDRKAVNVVAYLVENAVSQ